MKKIAIEIDEEIFNLLQKQATPFVDTPNDVLRRLLLKKSPTETLAVPTFRPVRSSTSLPVLPGGVPKALEHTLQVAYLVRHREMSRSSATQRLADIHRVAPQTILDKYCRQLELTAAEFDHLLEEADLKSLKNLLHKKFPTHFRVINDYLSFQKSS